MITAQLFKSVESKFPSNPSILVQNCGWIANMPISAFIIFLFFELPSFADGVSDPHPRRSHDCRCAQNGNSLFTENQIASKMWEDSIGCSTLDITMKQPDHRRSARKPLSFPAEYSYLLGTWLTTAGEAVTLNLSEHGALIRSKVQLQVMAGDVISLTLGLDHGKVTLEGRVARVVANFDGSCDVGVVFRNLSAEDEYLLALQLTKKAP